jgi:hypothetical protein
MGAWGVGLYSSDFAQDLRGTVKAVARLPFAPETLLEHICATVPRSATDPGDSDYTVFWLTVADQFAQRGIDSLAARERALDIIASGADLAAMASLGMDGTPLARRRAMLEQVGARIAAPIEADKRRGVLKAPQKLLLDVGELLTYPVCQGKPINPYAVGKDWAWVKAWRRDGWGAAAIVDRGLAFGFLAWYTPVVLAEPAPNEPTLAELTQPRLWIARRPGTLTARHAANMQLKSLGRVAIDPDRLSHFAPPIGGLSAAVNDISIANSLYASRAGGPRIRGLSDIAGHSSTPQTSDDRTLTGRWRGEYSYHSGKRPPVAFAAVVKEDDGWVSGEITETVVGAGGVARARAAGIEGRRLRWLVKFAKTYEASLQRAQAVEYEGEIDDAAGPVTGQWRIPGNWSGPFKMTRDDG